MRKTTFFKTLLVAACLCLGSMSAWAKDVLNPTEATIIHGNGKNSGTEALSTVVHYDEDATTWNFNYVSINGTVFSNRLSNYGGSYVAIVKFDASSVLSGKALTSATLKFHSQCTEASKNSNVDVALIGTGWTASTATWDNTNTGSILSPVAVSTGTNVGTSGYNFSIDVYSQLNADIDKVIAFAFYTETGREQQLSDVTLEVESSVETLYKASFTANSGAITPTVTIYSDSDRTSEVTNGTLTDKTTYYYSAVLEGYKTSQGSFTVDGSNPSVSFTMTAKNVYNYTVKAVDGSANVLKVITSDSNYEGSTITYYWPAVLNINGTLYTTPAVSSQYKSTFELDSNNKEVTVTYTASNTINNVLFLAEGEDIFSQGTGSNADIRLSMGKGGYASSKTTFVTLPAGSYHIAGVSRGGTAGTYYHYFYKGTDENEFFKTEGSGTNSDFNHEFTLAETTSISMNGGSNNQLIDYVYIYGTIDKGTDVTCLIENSDMEISAGGASYWQEGVKGWGNTNNASNYRQLAISGVNNDSGAFTGTNAFENWTGVEGGLTGKMSQTITGIPNGVYKLQLAALVRTVNGQFIYGKSNGKTYKTSLSGAAETANDYEVIVVVEDHQLEIGLDMNSAGADWAAIDNARLTYTPSVSKTITSAGWATYCSPYALDFSDEIDNLTDVYIIEGATGSTLNLTSVKGGTVPANKGLLIEGTEGVVSIPVVANSSTDVSANKLVGVTAEYALAAEGGYVLMGSPKVGFYKNAYEFTLGANTAYLPYGFGDGYARSFFSFDDEETTGIADVREKTEDGRSNFFDLQGRRVAQPTKGLYIVNGRKIVIK